jgi:mono/diheme cytochrome c family protein
MSQRISPSAALGAALAVFFSLSGSPQATATDFSRDIQPLLAKRCFACHGPDTQEAGLRFDHAESAIAELDSGYQAIVPGDVDASEILSRVASTDPDLQMPPEGARLTHDEVSALRDWIRDGAQWKEHWAFRHE